MKSLRSNVIRAFAALALLSLANVAVAESDSALGERLIGQWREVRHLECEEHQQQMTMRRDGTFEVTGVLTSCDAKTQFVWRGTWQVKGGKLRYTTTYSKPAETYPLGETFEDEIVSVTDQSWTMIEGSTGNKSIAQRVK